MLKFRELQHRKHKEQTMAPATPRACLRVQGTDIVDADGKRVILKGVRYHLTTCLFELR